MPTFAADYLERVLTDIYQAVGALPSEAATVADHQVRANLAGHDSHGVIQTPAYVRQVEKGHVRPGAPFEVVSETPATAVVDGHMNFGFVVTQQVTSMVIDKVANSGVASVAVRHQGHIGRLGHYTTQIAAAGAIGMVTADSGRGPKAVAPFGGKVGRLGTNPLSIAVPSDLPGPVMLDMATSAVAGGKVRLAQTRGQQLPSPAVIGADGMATTDPAALFDGGALLPLGGPEGYKGYGLSFMVEVFSGLLTGIGFGIDPNGIHNDGITVTAFNVAHFRDLGEFKTEVGEFVQFLKDTPLAAGFDEILYPGELEHRTTLARTKSGIEIEDSTWTAIEELTSRLGVAR